MLCCQIVVQLHAKVLQLFTKPYNFQQKSYSFSESRTTFPPTKHLLHRKTIETRQQKNQTICQVLYRLRQDNRNISKSRKSLVTSQGDRHAVTFRDYATINELICLSNMENINAVLINDGMPQGERLVKLNQIAIQQMQVLEGNSGRNLLKQ